MSTTTSDTAGTPDTAAPGAAGRAPAATEPSPPVGGRGRRFLRGRPDDPRWARPTLLALLAVAAVTYLWDLGASGYANSFYAAAVQAGTQSWKAWLFGALDAPGVITVDKPPASLWVMALSGRIFGFSSWSMLVPQALMGVASVALVYATVRRWSGARTALAAAALLAFTPVAVLMFRFNNPDAMLVLVMIAAAYVTTRAVDAAGRKAGTWWLVAAGALVGLGFLTKQLQVMLVVPALGLVYLVVAPTRLRRRLLDLAASVAAIVVSAGWYVLLVDLWPASSRPYIGGSTDNSLLELALGYNGLGRILGGSGNGGGGGRGGGGGAPGGAPGSAAGGAAGGPPAAVPGGGLPSGSLPGGGPGGGGGGGGFGGSPSPLRMFTSEFSAQASWLLPAAVVVLVAGLWFTRRAPRTDRTRGLLLLGGAWMLVHAVVFSFMSGTIHPYYTVAMAPGIAMTAAAGASIAWRLRARPAARLVLAVSVLGTGVWSAVILTQQSLAVLGWVLAAVSLVGAVALLVPALTVRRLRALGVTAVVVAVLGGLGGSTALAAVTAVTPHQGSIVSAGSSSGGGPGGGAGGPGGGGGPGNAGVTAADRSGRADGLRRGGVGGGGGMEGETPSAALVALLQHAGTRWAAATTGANAAAPLELASGVPVISIGGFMGSDPAPTLAQFQEYVATGQVHYYVEGGGPGGGGFPGAGDRTGGAGTPGGGRERGTSSEISTWVAAHFTPTDVGGRTVYDLTAPRA